MKQVDAMANSGSFKKGQIRPNQGKRGPSKVTKELKEMILGALDDAGGQKYLLEQAKENSSAFLTLIGKVLPQTINANVSVIDKLSPGELAALERAISGVIGTDT